MWDVRIEEFDKKNVMRSAHQLVEIVNKEKDRGRDAILNISGLLRAFSIAAYIVGWTKLSS